MNYARGKDRVVRPSYNGGLVALREALAARGFALKPENATLESGKGGGLEATVEPGRVRLRIERRSSVQSVLNAVRGGLSTDARGRRLLFLVPHLTPGMLDECRKAGVCAADSDGNILLAVPGLYVEHYRQKPRTSRPSLTGSVFTARSSRLVRALLAKYPCACRQTELVEWTGVSPGYVSTRIKTLEGDGYVRRDGEKVRLTEPDRLLTDWARSYRFDRHLRLRYAISMASYEQGLDKVKAEMDRLGLRCAFTGWSAAYLAAPFGEPENIMAYVSGRPDPRQLRFLHPVDDGGDVVLLIPHDEGVFQFAVDLPGKPLLVSYAQLYVDLTRMSGRAPEQADVVRKKCLTFTEAPA